MHSVVVIRRFIQPQPYASLLQAMRDFTKQRTSDTPNALWLLEHVPVFTQGQAGKAEHIIAPGNIEVFQSDRGGQVTYHGPGQLMIYTLWDLKRQGCGIKKFVQLLQTSVITLLKGYEIDAQDEPGAPGVYVRKQKIASIGLRLSRGYLYHGMSLNINMDLSPFTRIHPCGFPDLAMTQISDFLPHITLDKLIDDIIPILLNQLQGTAP